MNGVRPGIGKIGSSRLRGKKPDCRGVGLIQGSLCRPVGEQNHTPVISIQGDQPSGVEREAAQAAARRPHLVFGFGGFQMPSAHSRSSAVIGPPVASSDSFRISPQR